MEMNETDSFNEGYVPHFRSGPTHKIQKQQKPSD